MASCLLAERHGDIPLFLVIRTKFAGGSFFFAFAPETFSDACLPWPFQFPAMSRSCRFHLGRIQNTDRFSVSETAQNRLKLRSRIHFNPWQASEGVLHQPVDSHSTHSRAQRKHFFEIASESSQEIDITHFFYMPRGWISLFFNSTTDPITPRLRIALRVMVSSLSSHKGRLVHCPAARMQPRPGGTFHLGRIIIASTPNPRPGKKKHWPAMETKNYVSF